MALVSQFLNAGDLRASRSAGVRDQSALFQLGRELRRLDQQFQFDQQANPLRLSQLEETLRASRFRNDFNEDVRDFDFSIRESEAGISADNARISRETVDDRIESSGLNLQGQRVDLTGARIELERQLNVLESTLQSDAALQQRDFDVINQARREQGLPPISPGNVSDQVNAIRAFVQDTFKGTAPPVAGAGGLGESPEATPIASAAALERSGVRAIDDGTAVGRGRRSVASVMNSAGIPPVVIAGFLGNFEVEGGYLGAVGDRGTAFGIAQWRNERVRNFIRVIGKHPRSASHAEQARFVLYEMNNPGQAGMTRRQRDAILAARTPEQAAALIDRYYERSNGKHVARRQSAARAFYAGGEFDGAAPTSSAPRRTTIKTLGIL